MATKKYKECDYCRARDIDGFLISNVFIQTGWQPDPAGGISIKDGKEYDLCPTCLVKLCNILIRYTADFETNKAVIKAFEQYRNSKV